MLEMDMNNLYGFKESLRVRESNKYVRLSEADKANARELAEGLNTLFEMFDEHFKRIETDYDISINESIENETYSERFENILMSEVYLTLSEDALSEGVRDKIKDIKHKYKEKEKSVDKSVANKLQDVLNGIKDDVREKHVEQIPFKLSKAIKIVIGAGAAITFMNPLCAAITLITGFIISKRLSRKEKDRLISEIREEILIVEEKIKDSDSNGDKKQKYQLMRLLNSLKRSEVRIRRSLV